MWGSILVGIIVLLLFFIKRKPKDYPPGPTPLPIFGNLFSLNLKQPHSTIKQWGDRYGPVFSMKLGATDVIVLTEPKIAKEVLQKTEASSRPPISAMLRGRGGLFGIVASSGRLWDENRRFTMRHLRELGMGKSALEVIVIDEIADFIQHNVEPNVGRDLELVMNVNVAVVNIIWRIIAGHRMEHGDEQIKSLLNDFEDFVMYAGRAGLIDNLPWIRPFVPKSFVNNDIFVQNTVNFQEKYGKGMIREHKESFQSTDMRDYVDWYLKQIEQEKNNPDTKFSETNLLYNIEDLFFAGQETTANTLRWTILFLCLYPDLQMRIQQEVDSVVGRSHLPTYLEREKMPFTQAFLSESQRKASILPLGVPHYTNSDIKVGQYTIPKNTQVWAALHYIHYNPDIWDHPERFDVNHFLNGDGKFVDNHEKFMPFETGRRQCPGESFARMELFLFVTSFLQHYNLRFARGHETDSEVFLNGSFTLCPKPYKVVFTRRD